MKTWNLEQRVRLDLAFAAAFFGIWALALCSGALLESTRLMDFSIVALIGALACAEVASVRKDLLNHTKSEEP